MSAKGRTDLIFRWGLVFNSLLLFSYLLAIPYGLPGPTTAGFLRTQYGADIPVDVPADQLIAVHPTQLYETAAALVIGAIGFWILRRGARPGTALFMVMLLLAVERFGVEFLRAKDDRILGPFTVAQGLSLVVVLVVGLLWKKRPRTETK